MSSAAQHHGRRAVFLDRDGTIIEDMDYLGDPAQARLLPGAAEGITRLNQTGFLAIVVTNQSGIARGVLSVDQYHAVEHQVGLLLEREGARLDAHYFCPHLPEVTGPCDCRKPGSLLYRQAAERFGIDLTRSWWVGDRLRDLLPAESFRGHGILVLTGAGKSEAGTAGAGRFPQAADLAAAAAVIANS